MRRSSEDYYASEMYQNGDAPTLTSARMVVPYLMKLVEPNSVVDVGCGHGGWLKVFQENGVSRILGLDGSYIQPSMLLIPATDFRAVDLASRFEIGQHFDLAICVEVAEHLPERQAAYLVAQLVSAADVVVFSAAPPGQGGYEHVNLKPLHYWRRLFAEHAYRMLDALRPRFRDCEQVLWFYRQNAVLFASPDAIRGHPELKALPEPPLGGESEWVHRNVADYLSHPYRTLPRLPREMCRSLYRLIFRAKVNPPG